MKRIGLRRRIQGDAVVIQGAPSVLVGEPFVELAVRENLPFEKGLEVEAAEPFPVTGIRAVMDAPQAGQKSTAAPLRNLLGFHGPSAYPAADIMGRRQAPRQGTPRVAVAIRILGRRSAAPPRLSGPLGSRSGQ